MLHSVDTRGWTNNVAWCVPTAVSFLTGTPLAHSHSRAAFMNDQALNQVSGVSIHNALLMLGEQGYVCERIDLKSRYDDAPLLSQFLADRTAYESCMPLLIIIEKQHSTFAHALSAHYNFVADNATMKPIPYTQYHHLDKLVVEARVIRKQ
jgi:hypothetical protein